MKSTHIKKECEAQPQNLLSTTKIISSIKILTKKEICKKKN